MERHYEYRQKWSAIVLGVLFFGACAAVLAAKAQGNDRGLIINGIFEFSAGAATIFYWVLAALSAGFVLIAACLAIVRLTSRRRIVLTESSLVVPRSRWWSTEEMVIPFGSIREVSASQVTGQRFLKIVHQGGKFTLVGTMLPKKDDFDEIQALVAQGMSSTQPHSPEAKAGGIPKA